MIEPSLDRGQGRSTRPGPTRILLVEDDAGMQRIVSEHFADHDVDVTPAANRAEAERRLAEGGFDLVVLDLRLGSENGLDLLRDLRARSDLPVIITTGHRRDEIDRVIGLELGADDYLVKPYGLRELLARVRVVLRRAEVAPAAARGQESGKDAPQDSHRSRFDGWVLDRRRRRLTNPAGADVALSKGEYALLVAFLDAPQRPLSREHLLQATRVHEDVFDRSIDVQILRLRRKLEVDPSAPRLIVTERGVGYVLATTVERL
ncbi:response regulator [Methylobacterium terricola]|uniref:Regulatory protein VirG n=1 Tax=Methylobacterium terricola TaxID=2583531 RepID=A0A5C4LG83_9HYPH|nr:response regulator [Methylobacterium terricola]TNC12982.1 response regulator [Methylobacterium terricola]